MYTRWEGIDVLAWEQGSFIEQRDVEHSNEVEKRDDGEEWLSWGAREDVQDDGRCYIEVLEWEDLES